MLRFVEVLTKQKFLIMTNHLPIWLQLKAIPDLEEIEPNKFKVTKENQTIFIKTEQVKEVLPQLCKTLIRLNNGYELSIYLSTFKLKKLC